MTGGAVQGGCKGLAGVATVCGRRLSHEAGHPPTDQCCLGIHSAPSVATVAEYSWVIAATRQRDKRQSRLWYSTAQYRLFTHFPSDVEEINKTAFPLLPSSESNLSHPGKENSRAIMGAIPGRLNFFSAPGHSRALWRIRRKCPEIKILMERTWESQRKILRRQNIAMFVLAAKFRRAHAIFFLPPPVYLTRSRSRFKFPTRRLSPAVPGRYCIVYNALYALDLECLDKMNTTLSQRAHIHGKDRRLYKKPNLEFRTSQTTTLVTHVGVLWLEYSPPTKSNRVRLPAGSSPDFRMRESWRTIPLVSGFLGDLPFSPPLHSDAASSSPRFAIIAEWCSAGANSDTEKRYLLFTRSGSRCEVGSGIVFPNLLSAQTEYACRIEEHIKHKAMFQPSKDNDHVARRRLPRRAKTTPLRMKTTTTSHKDNDHIAGRQRSHHRKTTTTSQENNDHVALRKRPRCMKITTTSHEDNDHVAGRQRPRRTNENEDRLRAYSDYGTKGLSYCGQRSKSFTSTESCLDDKAGVVLWLDYSPPTKTNRVRFPAGSPPDFRTCESCRTMPPVDGFSRGSPVFPAVAFCRRFKLISLHAHRLSRL
ncbi:hypothetical protein PR048_027729 [Dryococelus australis]|uniref:Uncharacterized protein n=1 Tax=Dryococelus australis TaxID=614101 RepID=A0ABQ9GHB1_9NEOP|nr:hypothetical protein PR048_027729 [Dryococelus australis]